MPAQPAMDRSRPGTARSGSWRTDRLVGRPRTDGAPIGPGGAPGDVCLPRRFEVMAGRLPDATALVLGSERVTYEALNRRANRLARRLQAAGVGPEVLVGLSTSRSCEM